MELENSGISCYTTGGGKKPVQTWRKQININDVILDYVEFERPEFKAVLKWLREQVITETKGIFTDIEVDRLGELAKYSKLKTVKNKQPRAENLNCVVDGFQFDFGTGGIHGSIDATVVEEDENFAILDYDVASLYPSIAIVNKIYPKHLTHKFCEIYSRMKKDRMSYAKGTIDSSEKGLAKSM